MDQMEAIQVRVSRRCFMDAPIAPEKLAELQRQIDAVNVESGLTVRYVADGGAAFAGGKSYGMFSGVRALLVLKGDRNLPHLKEKIGYYGEKLILTATALGLGTCWVGGTFDRNAAVFGAAESEEIVCVVPLGLVKEGGTVKEKLIRGVIHRKSKTINQMIESDAALSAPLVDAMKLVQRAPTARNTQKVLFTVQNGAISALVPDDYPLDLVDLGICKLHFEIGMGGRFEWGNHAVWNPPERTQGGL